MEIKHDKTGKKAWTTINGHTAYVEYEIINGAVDILHTFVPKPLEGQGIASELVKFVYDYALEARVWGVRHLFVCRQMAGKAPRV
jgi:predicted GNAT family acetyltransferase